ncbi:phosphatase PAP2 family protein [Streptomyces sp. NPDC059740]|uniref:phosphatase PAP2 family protein n=1 Tax=Streptomyces sp. NPDC059740 TaxID=3346926 RepID=UPI003665A5A4
MRVDAAALRTGPALLSPGAAHFLADLGNASVAVPVALTAVVFAVRAGLRARSSRWWLPPVAAAATCAAVPLLVVPLKALFARPAPPGPLAGTSGFFPSGHAATAVAAYAGAAVLLTGFLARRWVRRVVALTAVVLNAGVAVGLVVCGYHWPLDVVASWCLCGALLPALRACTRAAGSRASAPEGGTSDAGRGGAADPGRGGDVDGGPATDAGRAD